MNLSQINSQDYGHNDSLTKGKQLKSDFSHFCDFSYFLDFKSIDLKLEKLKQITNKLIVLKTKKD